MSRIIQVINRSHIILADILTIKNSQVSDEQKVIDMVKALRPLIQHIALMQYPNEDEEPQRQKVHLQWAQAIIDFVSTILTQNLSELNLCWYFRIFVNSYLLQL